MTARRVLGFCLALLGRIEEGRDQLEAALRLFRRDVHGGLVLRFGQDRASLPCRCWPASPACRATGRRATGSPPRRSAAHELGHSYTTAYATYIAGAAPSFLMDDLPATHRHLDALIELSTDGGFPFWKAFCDGLRAALAAREGRTAEARALVSERFEILDALSVYWFRPFIFAGLAEGFLHAGDRAAASSYV